MGLRRSFVNILLGPPEVTSADLRRVADEVAQGDPSGLDPAVEARMAKLEKKLNMAMGAVQAATAQIMALKKDLQETANAATKAGQQATTARSTAEATADGLTGVEEQLAALMEQLADAPEPKKGAKATKASTKNGRPETCSEPGCSNKHRARGYCAKHYQQHKREGTLESH